MKMILNDLISVIVPVYGVESYLQKCVDSIRKQSYSNLEILLVDDGSLDTSSIVCDDTAMQDQRLVVIHKPNGGLSDARNFGIELASGQFLSFVDSDDYISEEFLCSLYLAEKKTGCKLSICNMTAFDEQGNYNEKYYQPYTEEKLAVGHEHFESLTNHSACNKLYKAELFRNIRYPKGKLFEDLFVYHYILDKVDSTAYTGLNSYFYRTRSGSIMRSKYTVKSTEIIWGYYDRARFYDRRKEHRLADDAYLWVYSRTAIAFSHLDKSNQANVVRLKEIKKLYNSVILRMIIFSSFCAKQRLRCFILFLSPTLHEKIYPTLHLSN